MSKTSTGSETETRLAAQQARIEELEAMESRYQNLLLKAGDEIRELRQKQEASPAPSAEDGDHGKVLQALNEAKEQLAKTLAEHAEQAAELETLRSAMLSEEREPGSGAALVDDADEDQLFKTIDLQRQTIVDLRTSVAALEKEQNRFERMRTEIQRLNEELKESEEVRERQQKAMSTFAQVKVNAQAQYEELQGQYSEMVAQRDAARGVQTQLEARIAELEELAERLPHLEAEQAEMSQRAEASAALVLEKETALDSVRGRFAALEEENRELKAQAEASSLEMESLSSRVSEIPRLEKVAESLQESRAELEQALKEARAEFEQSVQRFEVDAEASEARIEELLAAVDSAKQGEKAAADHLIQLEAQLDEAKNEAAETRAQLDKVQSEADERGSGLEAAQSDLDAARSELEVARAEVKAVASELETVRNELTESLEKLVASEQEAVAARDEERRIGEQSTAKLAEVEALLEAERGRSKLEAERADAAEERLSEAPDADQISSLEAQLAAESEKLEALKVEFSEVDDRRVFAESQISALRAQTQQEADSRVGQREELKQDVARLEETLAARDRALEQLEELVRTAVGEREDLQGQLASSEKELERLRLQAEKALEERGQATAEAEKYKELYKSVRMEKLGQQESSPELQGDRLVKELRIDLDELDL